MNKPLKISQLNSQQSGMRKFIVEDYIKKQLADPDSYESVNWSPVSDLGKNTTAPHRYIVRHMYRVVYVQPRIRKV